MADNQERDQAWIVTSHAEVDRAFKDKTLSSARAMAGFRSKLAERHAGLMQHALSLLDGWMLLNDPPDHTRLRDPVRRSFTPAFAASLVPKIAQRVDELLDGLRDDAELVGDFAQPLTALVICDLLGVDAAEREFLRQWTRDYGQLIYGASSHQAGYAEAVGRAGDEFYARFSAVIAAKRRQPGPDLISHLLLTSEREQWTEAEQRVRSEQRARSEQWIRFEQGARPEQRAESAAVDFGRREIVVGGQGFA
jgi:cytochrome P450